MRGKTLMWICLIAVIVCSSMVNANVASASTTTVYIDPATYSVTDYDPTAPPKITFNINIADVEDLYAWGLRLRWDFTYLYCDIRDVEEGGFLKDDTPSPMGTAFAKVLNLVDRFLDMGCTTIGNYPGVSGSGTLATVELSVRELGTTDLDLFDVLLLDHNLNEIPCEVEDGYFESLASSPFGANLVQKRISSHCIQIPNPSNPYGNLTEKQEFFAKVKNVEGPYSLYVKVIFDIVHEGGDVWTGKTGAEYIGANSISPELGYEFILGQLAPWYPWPYWNGKFYCTATAYYSYGGVIWYQAPKLKTFSFTVVLNIGWE